MHRTSLGYAIMSSATRHPAHSPASTLIFPSAYRNAVFCPSSLQSSALPIITRYPGKHQHPPNIHTTIMSLSLPLLRESDWIGYCQRRSEHMHMTWNECTPLITHINYSLHSLCYLGSLVYGIFPCIFKLHEITVIPSRPISSHQCRHHEIQSTPMFTLFMLLVPFISKPELLPSFLVAEVR